MRALVAAVLSIAGWTCAATVVPTTGDLVAREGRLKIVVEDHPTASRTRRLLETDGGVLELRFTGKPPALRSGSRLRVRGRQSGGLLALDGNDAGAVTVVSTAPPVTAFGEQKLAVLLVNFQDNPVEPYSVAETHNLVFGQVDAFMKENSFQKTWLRGNTFGWLTLPMATTCLTGEIATAARQQALAAGIDLSAYARIIYAFPLHAPCVWSGVGTVGGAPSEAWINGRPEVKVTAHELGHNLGLYHSHSLDCDTVPIGATCSVLDYGDVGDAMGSNTASHFNAFQKERLGWLGSSGQPPITRVTASGSFSIDAYETATQLPKALKVPKGVDPATGRTTYYYVEYRRPIGFDAPLSTLYQSNLTQGLSIRIGSDGDANSSYLIDMTPNTVPTFDMTDAALTLGRSFTDPDTGTTISLVSVDPAAAWVDVVLGTAVQCQRRAPSLSVSAPVGSVAAGTAVAYNVVVSNQDSADCGASTITLQAQPPSGWTASWAAASLALNPGASGSTTLTVASPSSAPAGNYSITTTAASAAGGGSPAATAVLYSVGAANVLSSSVSTDKSVYRTGEAVTMTARVAAGGKPVSGASVRFDIAKPNGVTALTATTDAQGVAKARYKISRRDGRGAWQLQQTATYQSATSSAASGFVVE